MHNHTIIVSYKFFIQSFLVRKIGTSCLRLYSASAQKITTHYSIHPREADQRWKGIIFLCYLLFTLFFHFLFNL